MSTEQGEPLALHPATFARVREYAQAHGLTLCDALSVAVHLGLEALDRRDGSNDRIVAESSLRRLHELVDVALGPGVFASARLLAGREAAVTDGSIAEEEFLECTLAMGRHEWDAFTAELKAGRTRTQVG
jgi:hypothetical protein